MNDPRNFLKIIWTVFLSVFLIIVMRLSINSVLPLKWRFPQWRLSPHLAEITETMANGSRTHYVNGKNVVTVALDKNYATVIRSFDQNGNCELEQYFDNHGKPAITVNGYYALQREYNSEGQWTSTTYLNDKLKPTLSRYGYATVRRTYNEIGKVETEMYFDADGIPSLDVDKRFGARYEYDSERRTASATSLDADGNPMNNKYHYSIDQYIYSSDGKLYMEMYYDKDGNPVKLSDGQYGYIYENGKPVCIDQEGRKIFVLRLFLFRSIIVVLIIGVLLLILIMYVKRSLTWALLFLYLAFIVYMTFINREEGSSIVTWIIPPNHYLFFENTEVLANIWLFIPLGTIIYKLSHMKEIIVVPIALSLCIEFSQLMLDIGAFELSDLVSNSLGGVIGIIVCYLLEPLINNIRSGIEHRLLRQIPNIV